jgi:hypothetical protein
MLNMYLLHVFTVFLLRVLVLIVPSSGRTLCSLLKSNGVPMGGLGGSTPHPPKFRSFGKAEPNSQFRGKYIRNNLIRIRVSPI